MAKELARILKHLVGKSIHYVNNSKEFADEVRNTKLEEGECITSFDVIALYINSSSICIRGYQVRLEQDTELPNRTTLSASNIIELLRFCPNNTYFLFQDQFFEKTKGAAMGSLVSPIVAIIYMEAFKHRTINTALIPQGSGEGMLIRHL